MTKGKNRLTHRVLLLAAPIKRFLSLSLFLPPMRLVVFILIKIKSKISLAKHT